MWATPSAFFRASPVDDEEDANQRVFPDWHRYRQLMISRGYSLDTVRDVRQHYEQYWATLPARPHSSGYPRHDRSDNDLCRDPGLPENLFRGNRIRDGKRILVKAVNAFSRELETTRYLSSSALRADPRNHTIPVLDIISVSATNIAFIVQEEWAASFAQCAPATPRAFLHAMRQCLEGIHFMHSQRIAHLDISCTNILTNCNGMYAYIDFELSRRFPPGEDIVRGIRGAELPPEIERGQESSAFKVDIWALGQTILRAYRTSGLDIPGLMTFVQPMISESQSGRPSAKTALEQLDRMVLEDRFTRRRALSGFIN